MSFKYKVFAIISLWLIILICLLLKQSNIVDEKEDIENSLSDNIWIKEDEKKPEEEKIEEKVEPEFILWRKVREINTDKLGRVLSDIESHMPAGHGYSDRNLVTWGHETTHGINSNIRNSKGMGYNGFYCLNDRGCIIKEPEIKIKDISGHIPVGLRGPSYNLYLISQANSWNNQPLYLCDEWISYINGSEVGHELNHEGWYYELLQAHNFNIYCIVMMMQIKEKCKDYDDRQLRLFMMWNIERTFALMKPVEKEVRYISDGILDVETHHHFHEVPVDFGSDENPTGRASEYIDKVRTLPEGEGIRSFCREYFGIEWCRRVYDF